MSALENELSGKASTVTRGDGVSRKQWPSRRSRKGSLRRSRSKILLRWASLCFLGSTANSGSVSSGTNLFSYDWELTKSPAGAHQWTPKNGAGNGTVPDAHDPSKRHAPSMLITGRRTR